MVIEILSSFKDERILEGKKKMIIKINDECHVWIDDQRIIAENYFLRYRNATYR